jgi:hypothetical protein
MRIAHVMAFDDAPFDRAHRGDVPVVGVVYAGDRLEGAVSGRVRRDGANATSVLADLVARSRLRRHTQVLLLEGIALAGFNVVDLAGLHAATRLPVLVVTRRRPDLDAIRSALLTRVPGGRRKWRLIEQAGPMQPIGGLWTQRIGLSSDEVSGLIRRFAIHGRLPEPLRVAHILAGALLASRPPDPRRSGSVLDRS